MFLKKISNNSKEEPSSIDTVQADNNAEALLITELSANSITEPLVIWNTDIKSYKVWNGTTFSQLGKVAFIKIDEGGGVGFVIEGQDRTENSPVGDGTLDLSIGSAALNPRGHTGEQSIINGYNLLGNGYAVIGSGWDNRNNGNYCIVAGISNDTTGGGCVVGGAALNNAGGDLMGLFGQANILPTGNPYGLLIGNGLLSSVGGRVMNAAIRSDAFRVYNKGVNNGGIEAPSITNQIINAVGSKSLVSKEYVDKFYQFFQGLGNERLGQTTIPLMNQQANTLEDYIIQSYAITRTDNYKITISTLTSINQVSNDDFLLQLSIDDGTTIEYLDMIVEHKDPSGTGILVDVLQGGQIEPQLDTGTDQRVPYTFPFNRQLDAGKTYLFKLSFGSDLANSRATIYQGQVMVEQKTLTL